MLIKEFGNSIFYINDKHHLIEYNILSKKCYLHVRYMNSLVCDYFIVDGNKIIIRSYYEKIIVTLNNQNINMMHIPLYFPFDGNIRFLKTSESVYFNIAGNDYSYICAINGNLKLMSGFFLPSNDGKKLMYKDGEITYFADTNDVLPNILNNSNSKIGNRKIMRTLRKKGVTVRKGSFERFVHNSYHLVFHFRNKKWYIENINNQSEMRINYCCRKHCRYVDIGNFLIEIDQGINVYTVDNLKYLRTIQYNSNRISFHNGLRLLLFEDTSGAFEYYRLNSYCELENVKLGSNYTIDCKVISIYIMDILMDVGLIFDLLPYEIIYVELYQQMILICDPNLFIK